jgi:hypothetical protein
MKKMLLIADVTPMASAVSNGEEYWLIFTYCTGECLRAPWIPIYRIVGVLQEVG